MKIALICDTHIGCRGDSATFLWHQKQFYDNIFFPTLVSYGITDILHLGDVFDRRKFINYNTFKNAKEFLFDPLKANGYKMTVALGNHDVFYTNTNEVNSVELLLEGYDNISIIRDKPTQLTFDKASFLLVPWINKQNHDLCISEIQNSSANVCAGHFAIEGFEMNRGSVNTGGQKKELFDHFHSVFSGHFHHPSTQGNITYLGAPYEMTWSDYDGNRGFHIFDTETLETEWILNPYRVFHKFHYDDTDVQFDDLVDMDFSIYKNGYVKIIVQTKTNSYLLDMLVNNIADAGAVDVKVLDETFNISETELITEEKKMGDTRAVFREYIEAIDTKLDKIKIVEFVDKLYHEALERE